MNTNEQPVETDREAAGLKSTSGGNSGESLLSAGDATPETLGTPEVPTQFGRYRIVRRLGHGGMGSVYLAEDSQLGRNVALKIPRLSKDNRKRATERFHREARAAAVLNHPNLCPVHDVGEVDGVPYLTMAFVEGRPLSDYIHADKGLPQLQTAGIVRKIALALAEAHARGIVHRDLKPANVMINQRKEPIVTDFGLAQLDAQEGTRLTQMGMVLGTPSYMPPEQVAGNLEAIGPASDIYSLGVILYEMLTGRLPFEGPITAVLGQILAIEAKPPSQFRANLDPRLEAICLKAMAKKVDDRFGTMNDLAAALADFMRNSTASSGGKEALQSTVKETRPNVQPKSTLIEARPKAAPKSTMIEPPPLPNSKSIVAPSKLAKKTVDSDQPSRAKAHRWPSGKVLLASGLALAMLVAATIITLAIIRVETKIGTVVLDIREPGAEVSIDGKQRITITDANSKEPIRIEIEDGKHELKVTKGGFETYTHGFTLKKGDAITHSVVLVPLKKPKDPDPVIVEAAPKSKPKDDVKPKEPDRFAVAPAKKDPPPAAKPIVVDRSHWISIMPTETQARESGVARFRGDGVLAMQGNANNGNAGFGTRDTPYWAKDAAIRAVVKVAEGNAFFLMIRGIDRPDNGYAFENYVVVFDGRRFKLSKYLVQGKGYREVVIKQAEPMQRLSDFFEFKVKAVGDLITVEADGEEVLRAHDSTLDQGGVLAFKVVDRGSALVKSADIQILDFTNGVPPEGKSYLPRDKWFSVNPLCHNSWTWDKNDQSRNWLKMDNGVLTLKNGACPLGSIQAKNVSIRAKFKFLQGEQTGNMALSLREGPNKDSKCYYTSCNRKRDGTLVVWMNDQGIERKNVPKDFFDLQVTAVADLITVHLNGEPVIEYRDPDRSMQRVGGVGINCWQCHGMIKEVEVKVMD